MYSKSKTELKATGIIILILSFLLPFLPPKYRGSKAMLDMMSYPAAVISIVSVFVLIFLWSYYFMIHTLKKDLVEKIKITVNTFVTVKGEGKYKGRKYYFFSASAIPYRLGRLPMTEEEYGLIHKGDAVIVEYAKHSKRYLGWRKVNELKG